MEGMSQGEPSWPKKPFSLMAASKLPLGITLPFHVWQKPYFYSLDDVVASSIVVAPKPYLQFTSSNTSSALEADAGASGKREEYSTPDFDEKNSTHGSGALSVGAIGVGSTAKTDEEQTQQPQPADSARCSDLDPKKLKRIMSNRLSAQKSRLKKIKHLADLERQAKNFETQIAILQPQVAAYKTQKQLLIWEKTTLSQKLAAREKEKFVKEAEIEKNQAEVRMLRELEKKQDEELQAQAMMVFNGNTGLQQLSDSKKKFGPGQMVYTNSAQEETSAMELDNSQNQGQMWILDPNDQKLNFNTAELSELDAIVNTPMPNNKAFNPDFCYGFKY